MSVDPLLKAFVPVIVAVLAAALLLVSLLWLTLRRRAPGLVREVWLRYVAWLGITAVVLGALAAGRTAWIVLVGVMSLAAFREYARAVGLWMDRAFQAVVYVFILLIHVCAWWPYPDASPEPGWYGLFMAMPVYATLAILTVPIARDQFEHMLQKTCLAILGLVYFGWLLAHLAYLVNLPSGVGLVLFLAFLVGINDVAAFVAGKLAGRHKLRPRLSPGKTWEGAAGAFVVALMVAWLLRWLIPAYSLPHVLVVAALVSVGGMLGDLALSTIKRDLGIKDWGELIPGHGGLLDRVNSLIFSAPIFFHYTRYFFT